MSVVIVKHVTIGKHLKNSYMSWYFSYTLKTVIFNVTSGKHKKNSYTSG